VPHFGGAKEIDMKTMTVKLTAAFAAAVAIAAPTLVEARTGGVGGGVAMSGGHGNWNGGGSGRFRGGSGRFRGGWGSGPFWGGLGLGLGFSALVYPGPYYGGYYGGYYGYPYPGYVVGPGAEYVVVDPASGDRAVRSSGQPVPAATRSPDPIFYPKNGQTTAKTETDAQECNRWATTQAGAMNDASIFQRATFACMEGRGYIVK
jgi:hypothetical protein